CIFSGNRATSYGGGLYNETNAAATLINCTLAGNAARYGGGGIDTHEGSLILTDCILWDNIDDSGTGQSAQVYAPWEMSVVFNYNCIAGWTGQPGGVGNIASDPRFVDPGRWTDPGTPQNTSDDIWVEGDYHLKTEGWRWDASGGRWTYDDVTSRCIDAGNPAAPMEEELLTVPADPTGEWGRNIRINMGAYGGTQEASIGPVNGAFLADITNDKVVNMADLAFFAAHWLQTDCRSPIRCGGADFLRNGRVGLDDFGALANDWLNRPLRSGPVAHWKFDGNYLEAVGDYNGFAIGDPLFVTGYFARVGSGALRLDGFDDRVQITGYKGIGGGSSRTVCAWIKTTDTEGEIISWGANAIPGGRWIFVTESDGFLRLEVGGGAIVGSTFVCDDQWHHVAAVLENDGSPNVNEIKLYVDGAMDDPTSAGDREINTVTDPSVSPDVKIGLYGDGQRFFGGLIDEVRIYDRPLTAEEIATLVP
ncbi:MAG: hypothetical protein J7M40_03445, partial [Planctomycetes bacterium]|nr:hypothetical protein [Planctomycetota bacterium]